MLGCGCHQTIQIIQLFYHGCGCHQTIQIILLFYHGCGCHQKVQIILLLFFNRMRMPFVEFAVYYWWFRSCCLSRVYYLCRVI